MHPEIEFVYENFLSEEIRRLCDKFNFTIDDLSTEQIKQIENVAKTKTEIEMLKINKDLLDMFGIIPIRK